MGDPLSEDAEVLFRQVHPSFIQNEQPSSQPFAPTPKDDNKLSVDRGSLTTPAASYALHTGAGHASAAVYGVSVGEFRAEAIPCISDPLEAADGEPANDAHAYADYSDHGVNQQKLKAKRLKLKAVARGRLLP